MGVKLSSAAFHQVLLWCLVTTTFAETLWSPEGRQTDTCEPAKPNWLQACVEAQRYPCPLPDGQFPWDREDYNTLLTDVDIVPGLSQADILRVLLQKFKALKLWSAVLHCMGIGTGQFDVFRKLPSLMHKQQPFTLVNDNDMKSTYEDFEGVEVLMYQPASQQGALHRGLVYFHGGGWVTGSAESRDALSRMLAKSVDLVVINVNYRLAPEHVYPAPLNDCVKATKYFMANAKRFGVDVNRIAVAGDSSGGNLAAAVALRARDENWSPALKAQVLFYPPLQAINFNTPSYERFRCTAHLDLPSVVTAHLAYAFGEVTRFRLSDFAHNGHVSASAKEHYSSYVDVSLAHNSTGPSHAPSLAANDSLWDELKDVFTDPYFAPLMARDLSGLPATFLSTAQQDVLLDDGVIYAARLGQAGVDVLHRHYLTIHGTVSYMFLDAARILAADVADYLEANL